MFEHISENFRRALGIEHIVLYFFDVYKTPVLVDGFTDFDDPVAARESPWQPVVIFSSGTWGRAERLYDRLSAVGCLWQHWG